MQIKTNPSSQRSFAKFLRSLTAELAKQELAIETARQHLGSSWKDRKYHEFSRSLEETYKELQKFYAQSIKYADYLERKAAAGDKFLQHR